MSPRLWHVTTFLAASLLLACGSTPPPVDPSRAPRVPPPPEEKETVEAFAPIQGTLDGKPFSLRGAATVGAIQKDGRVRVVLANYPLDCSAHDDAFGDRLVTLVIPWHEGTSVDFLARLRPREVSARGVNKKNKPVPLRSFHPRGALNVLSAPMGARVSGRVNIRFRSGKDSLEAEVPVKFCPGN